MRRGRHPKSSMRYYSGHAKRKVVNGGKMMGY